MKEVGKIPNDLRFTKTHEWIRVEGHCATVGITDYAQRELTDIVYVELPAPGRQLCAGECAAVLESVKAASEVYSPLSGKVLESNVRLQQEPGLVNQDPYGDGWLYKLEIQNPSEINHLLDAGAYAKVIGQET